MNINEFRTFNEFVAEANIAEITVTIDKNAPPSQKSLIEDVLILAKNLGVILNEDLGKTGDSNVGYGVKGKLKAKGEQEDGQIVNPHSEISKDDKSVLSDISSKITRGIQLFGDLEEFLDKYAKINKKPISTILAQLTSFAEAIEKELSQIPN